MSPIGNKPDVTVQREMGRSGATVEMTVLKSVEAKILGRWAACAVEGLFSFFIIARD